MLASQESSDGPDGTRLVKSLTPSFRALLLIKHADLQQQIALAPEGEQVLVAVDAASGEALYVCVLDSGREGRVEVRVEFPSRTPVRRWYQRDELVGIPSTRLAWLVLEELEKLLQGAEEH